mgnify:FL=1
MAKDAKLTAQGQSLVGSVLPLEHLENQVVYLNVSILLLLGLSILLSNAMMTMF